MTSECVQGFVIRLTDEGVFVGEVRSQVVRMGVSTRQCGRVLRIVDVRIKPVRVRVSACACTYVHPCVQKIDHRD